MCELLEVKIGGRADLSIEVSAIVNDLSLWTSNKKHFDRLRRYGLRL